MVRNPQRRRTTLQETNKKQVILVVDDEIELRQSICSLFKRKGFEVLEASGGAMAYEIILKEPVDIVLSDVRMPDGDGLELLIKIKERNSQTPRLALMTAFSDVTAMDAYDHGAEAMVSKPFDRTSVVQQIHDSLKPLAERWLLQPSHPEWGPPLSVQMPSLNLEEAIKQKFIRFGQGGMFLALNQEMPGVDSFIHFEIQFRDQSVFKGSGNVRWIRKRPTGDALAGLGLEFVLLHGLSRDAYFHCINRNGMPKAFIPRG